MAADSSIFPSSSALSTQHSALVFLGLSVAAAMFLTACAAKKPAEVTAPIALLAVLPIERVPYESETERLEERVSREPLPEDAGSAVTAQIYRVLTERSDFRFVADLAASDALESPEVRRATDLPERALAFGKELGANGVIFGTVSRFEERVGTELGATRPAAVSFELQILDVKSDRVIWRGRFDRVQEPLSYNLFDFWMFWRGGPRWFTARELTYLGVERLYKDFRRFAHVKESAE
jgi:hypothetical protein